MTASDNLQPQQFYHGSNQEFNVGDEIKPGDMVPRTVNSRVDTSKAIPGSTTAIAAARTYRMSDDFADYGHGQFTWMTTQPEHAKRYGKHVYEVEPQGLTGDYHWPESEHKFKNVKVSLAPVRVVRKHEGPFVGDTK